jgi:DNA-binding CsgD family transcriptional regulator
MLQGGYSSVLQARNREEFRDEVVRFGRALGFDMVSAIAVVDKGIGRSEFVVVDNTPKEWQGSFNDARAMQRDPVMQHCKRQSLPIIWDQGTYTSQGQGELWEEQARYGYQTGIAMALHLPEGKHFMLGVDRDRALPSATAQEAPALTPRELEALRWTMDGKTAWEVGSILGITERTAVLHLNNAMRKLGCVNKHQAVLKALRLGLIR